MNFDHLQMLVLSAELGSFSACAKKLGKVQSAVSHGISNLEIDLDLVLFDRSSRKPVLTRDGERIYQRAKVLLAQLNDLEQISKSIHKKEEGLITIALDSCLHTHHLNDVFAQFAKEFPYTQLELKMQPSPDIIAMIQNSEAHLGIMISDLLVKSHVDFQYVGHLEFIPVCHPQSPLLKLESINVLALTQYLQIGIRGNQTEILSQNPTFSDKVWWCNSFQAALSLVTDGIGWAYLPRFAIETLLATNKLKIMPVEFDKKPWNVPIELIMSKKMTPGPALSWLSQALSQSLTQATRW